MSLTQFRAYAQPDIFRRERNINVSGNAFPCTNEHVYSTVLLYCRSVCVVPINQPDYTWLFIRLFRTWMEFQGAQITSGFLRIDLWNKKSWSLFTEANTHPHVWCVWGNNRIKYLVSLLYNLILKVLKGDTYFLFKSLWSSLVLRKLNTILCKYSWGEVTTVLPSDRTDKYKKYPILFIQKVGPKHSMIIPLEQNLKTTSLLSPEHSWAHGACTSLIWSIRYL